MILTTTRSNETASLGTGSSQSPNRQGRKPLRHREVVRSQTYDRSSSYRLLETIEGCKGRGPFTAHRGGVFDFDGPELAVGIEHQVDLTAVAITIEIELRIT